MAVSRTRLRSFIQRLGGITGRRTGDGLSDAVLLERFIAGGDQAAFETLVWRHSALVLGVCRRVLRHEQDAEDAFQAAFLIFARKAGSIGNRQSLGAWLHRVALRAALACRAASPRRAVLEQYAGVPAASLRDPAEQAARAELGTALDAEVHRLPKRYRVPVVLHYLEGCSYEEVAQHLGCTRGTVATRLARGRDLLRRRLTRRGLAPAAGLFAAGPAGAAVPLAAPGALVEAVLGAARPGGAGSRVASRLAEGVLRSMWMVKAKFFAAALLAGIVTSGLGVSAYRATAGRPQASTPQGKPVDDPPPAAGPAKPPQPNRARSAANLQKLALAMHAYVEVHGRFPPAALTARDGKPLLSWRVLLLPHLGHKDLYRQFKTGEPWDGPHNRKLLAQIPDVFAPVRGASGVADSTFYQLFAGKGTMFDDPDGVRPEDVTDGTSATVLLVEAGQAVPWTRPADVAYAPGRPLPRLGGLFKGGFHIALVDGSVQFVKKDFPEQVMHAAITRAGGEVVDLKELGTFVPVK
jgi:RNA polymerase sigma factor (sigma-70 family)